MNKFYGLPVWTTDARIDASCGIVANEKAFDGDLKLCSISVDNNDVDLLSFMRCKKNEIQHFICLNTYIQPQKIEFGATIELTKPVDEETSITLVDHKKIFVMLKKQLVVSPGMNDACFSDMTLQIMRALRNFSTQGSGLSINHIKIRLVKTKPIRALSKWFSLSSNRKHRRRGLVASWRHYVFHHDRKWLKVGFRKRRVSKVSECNTIQAPQNTSDFFYF